jgi:fimbrial chaperone protein
MILEILKRGRFAAAATLFALAVTAPAATAWASSFGVSPIYVTLAPDRATTELSIRNTGAMPVAVRVTALRWTQLDGADVQEATTDVIAYPPIFTIAPGASQTVRIGLRTRTAGAAYRLILEEIPGSNEGASGIRTTLNLNLPFYVLARGGVPALSWTARRDAAGLLIVEAHNSGTAHSQIIGIEAQDAAGVQIGSTSAMGVVLPGSSRRWTLGAGSGTAVNLLVRGPRGITRSTVLVERP